VLDAQRQLFSAELDLASTTRDQLTAVVQLYKALGGGWQSQSPAGHSISTDFNASGSLPTLR
jgi:multidrug efflux system outer membrane protein